MQRTGAPAVRGWPGVEEWSEVGEWTTMGGWPAVGAGRAEGPSGSRAAPRSCLGAGDVSSYPRHCRTPLAGGSDSARTPRPVEHTRGRGSDRPLAVPMGERLALLMSMR